MQNISFFKKTKKSPKVLAGGPTPEEQLRAMAENKYWTVLNAHVLIDCHGDKLFTDRINAFKCALQTYGPNSEQLPSHLPNAGKAAGSVFHGHIRNSNGTTYIIEWTVVDQKKRQMALLGFAPHENYPFQKNALKPAEHLSILSNPKNINITQHVSKKINEAKAKVERVELNYRHMKTTPPII